MTFSVRPSRVLVTLALSALISAPALAATANPTIPPFGVDLKGRDLSVKPGNDFYSYAGGTWMKTEKLPSDRTSWTSFTKLADENETRIRSILEATSTHSTIPGSNDQKIGDFYASFLDTKSIEAAGLNKAAPALLALSQAESHEAVAHLMGSAALGLPGPIDMGITLDEKNPDRYVVGISHGGLGLPDRDFYIRDEDQFKTVRTAYQAHIGRMLQLVDYPENDAKLAAERIVRLETEIAKLHWPRADRRDRDRTYNPMTVEELEKLAPDFPWRNLLEGADLMEPGTIIVAEKSAIAPLAHLFRTTDLADWRNYMVYHFLAHHAAVLPSAFDQEAFDFYDHTLSGQPEQRARWKRAVGATNGALGEAVGRIYVDRYFPAESKAAAVELVENLRKAYAERIQSAQWMSPATREAALRKLSTFRPKIGYPDHWRDYSALEVVRGDAFGNMERAATFAWKREVERLHKPTDRDEWFMSPQTINAYYNPIFNEIVFPAAILQPPFFDPKADAAVNYGGIGGVIGHEMSHGFDDQGAKSDENGVLRDWWTAADVNAFKAFGDHLADQYSAFEPLSGIKVNGRLTLGENLGDVGGISVAYAAYHRALGDAKAPMLDGTTGDQRFFLGWAQVWRTLIRDEALRNRLLTDPHSPGVYRVNGVVRNVDAWYAAFGVQPTDELYLKPEDRVHVW
jgi:putative endopeptidase